MNRLFVLRSEQHLEACINFLRSNWKHFGVLGNGHLAVDVHEHKDKRSSLQNARLHALLREIAEQAWVGGKQYDAETWKEFFRKKFIGTEDLRLPDGTFSHRGVSTTTLSVGEFAQFMTEVEAYAAQELAVEFVL